MDDIVADWNEAWNEAVDANAPEGGAVTGTGEDAEG